MKSTGGRSSSELQKLGYMAGYQDNNPSNDKPGDMSYYDACARARVHVTRAAAITHGTHIPITSPVPYTAVRGPIQYKDTVLAV